MTVPTGGPFLLYFVSLAGDSAPLDLEADQLAADPPRLLGGERVAADEVALVIFTTQASPASNGVVVSSISWP